MNLRQQAREMSREAIIDAAGPQFAAYGYEATSFARVAEAMGKPRSAIGYHIFPSKLMLATSVIERQQAVWRQLEDGLEVVPGIERLVTLLLTSTMQARRSPFAAGAIRLLHELPQAGLEVPREYVWADVVREQFRVAALLKDPGEPEVGDDAVSLMLSATFGLLTASSDVDEARFEQRLKSLWTPLLHSFGFADAESAVERTEPASLVGASRLQG
ncbi:TetR/AcrR family transcriptional regulator [Curtobacterium flaccumfaciens]|uniref:TetR/AcrR family transcriptional regulator n=1 Tax=Curtobacterium flaccumfaciens TaxID=2035 RepID=UPI001BDEBD61|nr:TetR/AcrR family transcriptional regulator [Curtobacterium flaccumfaciens]MBT1631569.1 TetR/AcrR family transcriptional regulator [Curtobacterium flaccumfaciens pv. oortii]MCS5524643.1 TetR/AcrR family transcriptional regulator [Curtobacterium flaccumfaciens pv. oortii]MCX2847012.1 TetR/AcrR family transcriptional regulator [Curtobacterium flaccumfaciens pv. oortii]